MKLIYYIIGIIVIIIYGITEDWSKLFVFPLLCFCIYRGKNEIYWFNPYFLFLSTLISFLFYFHELGPFLLDKLPSTTLFFILTCLLAIVLGFETVKNKRIRPASSRKRNESFIIVFLIGLLPTALSYFMYGNILDVTQDLEEARAAHYIPMIDQLRYFLPASIIIACKNNNTKQIIIAIFFSVIGALMTVSKTALLMALIFFLVGITYYKPEIIQSKLYNLAKRYVFILIPLMVFYMFAYNNTKRQEADSKSSGEFIVRGGSRLITSNGDFAENMFLNYLYYCSPWSNLNYNIQKNEECGYGVNTFSQFGKKLGVQMDKVEKIQPSFLNTHTFITDFYLDFGYIGAIIASFILGAIIFFFYKKFCFAGDALLISYYCLISFATVMMFFSNHFTNGYLLNYLITMGGYYVLSQKILIKK